MLGSSRTTVGFKASQLERELARHCNRPVVAFNFGITGAGPMLQLLSLQRLLDRGIRPDLLLIEVLPPVLAGQLPNAELERLAVSRLWLGELPLLERYGAPGPHVRNTWWQGWPIPWYTRRFAIVSRFAPAFLPYQLRTDWFYAIDDSGWVDHAFKVPTAEQHRRAVEGARQAYAYYLVGFRLGGRACQALQEILELCRTEGIQTALVLMPEGVDFRSWYTSEAWTQIETFLGELHRDFAIPVINAREWIADDQFADSHHLLRHGAVVFTQRLGQEVVLPFIRHGNLPPFRGSHVKSALPESAKSSTGN
jgi:hypothetical protein